MLSDTENLCFWGKTGSDLPTGQSGAIDPSATSEPSAKFLHRAVPGIKTHAHVVVCFPSNPRKEGPHASHYRTAGINSCVRQCGCRVAARRARAAARKAGADWISVIQLPARRQP